MTLLIITSFLGTVSRLNRRGEAVDLLNIVMQTYFVIAVGINSIRRPISCVYYLSVSVVLLRLKHGINGYGELEFDSGEGAVGLATTSKDSSRRENCPMSIR